MPMSVVKSNLRIVAFLLRICVACGWPFWAMAWFDDSTGAGGSAFTPLRNHKANSMIAGIAIQCVHSDYVTIPGHMTIYG